MLRCWAHDVTLSAAGLALPRAQDPFTESRRNLAQQKFLGNDDRSDFLGVSEGASRSASSLRGTLLDSKRSKNSSNRQTPGHSYGCVICPMHSAGMKLGRSEYGWLAHTMHFSHTASFLFDFQNGLLE